MLKDLKINYGSYNFNILPGISNKPFFYGYITHWVSQKTELHTIPLTHSLEDNCYLCKKCLEQETEILDLRLTDLIGHKKYDMLINFNNDIYRLICSKFLWSNIFSISRKLGDPTDPETGYGFTITVDEKKIIKNIKPLTAVHFAELLILIK